MSITLREVAAGRRRFLMDLRTLMGRFDREQESLENLIKRILANPKRIPEPKDMLRMLDILNEILNAEDTFITLLTFGLPDTVYERQYGGRTTKRGRAPAIKPPREKQTYGK